MIPNAVLKDLRNPEVTQTQRVLDNTTSMLLEKEDLLTKLQKELASLQKKRYEDPPSHTGDTTLGTLHAGFSQFQNAETVETLEEKMDFMSKKLEQLEDMREKESVYSLRLNYKLSQIKEQRIYDNRLYQQQLPKLHRVVKLTDDIKQANFLSHASNINQTKGINKCRDQLIAAKINNHEQVKLKQLESADLEQERKQLNATSSQKSMKYFEIKKKLEQLKKRNEGIQVEDMKY